MPFLGAAGLLLAVKPVTAPVALILIAHAWIIPELYAARGAGVLRPRPATQAAAEKAPAERAAAKRADGLLGDLVGHAARGLHARTGLVVEPAGLGVWLVGEVGAVLIAPGGRRVYCYCVKVAEPELPAADRIAHLLLALRADESGFATVANLAFCGAPWRLRRRLSVTARDGLDHAVLTARAAG